MKKIILLAMAALSMPPSLFSQTGSVALASGGASADTVQAARLRVSKVHRQRSFKSTVPHGDYSGITYLGDNRYAVVSDKSPTDGFFVFHIVIDSITGRLVSVSNEGFRSAATPNRDQEGIAYVAPTGTLFISGEGDNRIREYALDGHLTGRELAIPSVFASATANYGFESLVFNAATGLFWTTTESTLPSDGAQAAPGNGVGNMLRLQSFGLDLRPRGQYLYAMDAPTATRAAANYAMGVSELCALDDGSLIVLEREFYVAKGKLGSFVNCKLYVVDPAVAAIGSMLDKRLLCEFRTRLSLFGFGIANYEGMCLAPRLADGRMVLLMVSDSQSGYKGVLKDWFKTIVLDR